jgi:hypothetical protein
MGLVPTPLLSLGGVDDCKPHKCTRREQIQDAHEDVVFVPRVVLVHAHADAWATISWIGTVPAIIADTTGVCAPILDKKSTARAASIFEYLGVVSQGDGNYENCEVGGLGLCSRTRRGEQNLWSPSLSLAKRLPAIEKIVPALFSLLHASLHKGSGVSGSVSVITNERARVEDVLVCLSVLAATCPSGSSSASRLEIWWRELWELFDAVDSAWGVRVDAHNTTSYGLFKRLSWDAARTQRSLTISESTTVACPADHLVLTLRHALAHWQNASSDLAIRLIKPFLARLTRHIVAAIQIQALSALDSCAHSSIEPSILILWRAVISSAQQVLLSEACMLSEASLLGIGETASDNYWSMLLDAFLVVQVRGCDYGGQNEKKPDESGTFQSSLKRHQTLQALSKGTIEFLWGIVVFVARVHYHIRTSPEERKAMSEDDDCGFCCSSPLVGPLLAASPLRCDPSRPFSGMEYVSPQYRSEATIKADAWLSALLEAPRNPCVAKPHDHAYVVCLLHRVAALVRCGCSPFVQPRTGKRLPQTTGKSSTVPSMIPNEKISQRCWLPPSTQALCDGILNLWVACIALNANAVLGASSSPAAVEARQRRIQRRLQECGNETLSEEECHSFFVDDERGDDFDDMLEDISEDEINSGEDAGAPAAIDSEGIQRRRRERQRVIWAMFPTASSLFNDAAKITQHEEDAETLRRPHSLGHEARLKAHASNVSRMLQAMEAFSAPALPGALGYGSHREALERGTIAQRARCLVRQLLDLWTAAMLPESAQPAISVAGSSSESPGCIPPKLSSRSPTGLAMGSAALPLTAGVLPSQSFGVPAALSGNEPTPNFHTASPAVRRKGALCGPREAAAAVVASMSRVATAGLETECLASKRTRALGFLRRDFEALAKMALAKAAYSSCGATTTKREGEERRSDMNTKRKSLGWCTSAAAGLQCLVAHSALSWVLAVATPLSMASIENEIMGVFDSKQTGPVCSGDVAPFTSTAALLNDLREIDRLLKFIFKVVNAPTESLATRAAPSSGDHNDASVSAQEEHGRGGVSLRDKEKDDSEFEDDRELRIHHGTKRSDSSCSSNSSSHQVRSHRSQQSVKDSAFYEAATACNTVVCIAALALLNMASMAEYEQQESKKGARMVIVGVPGFEGGVKVSGSSDTPLAGNLSSEVHMHREGGCRVRFKVAEKMSGGLRRALLWLIRACAALTSPSCFTLGVDNALRTSKVDLRRNGDVHRESGASPPQNDVALGLAAECAAAAATFASVAAAAMMAVLNVVFDNCSCTTDLHSVWRCAMSLPVARFLKLAMSPRMIAHASHALSALLRVAALVAAPIYPNPETVIVAPEAISTAEVITCSSTEYVGTLWRFARFAWTPMSFPAPFNNIPFVPASISAPLYPKQQKETNSWQGGQEHQQGFPSSEDPTESGAQQRSLFATNGARSGKEKVLSPTFGPVTGLVNGNVFLGMPPRGLAEHFPVQAAAVEKRLDQVGVSTFPESPSSSAYGLRSTPGAKLMPQAPWRRQHIETIVAVPCADSIIDVLTALAAAAATKGDEHTIEDFCLHLAAIGEPSSYLSSSAVVWQRLLAPTFYARLARCWNTPSLLPAHSGRGMFATVAWMHGAVDLRARVPLALVHILETASGTRATYHSSSRGLSGTTALHTKEYMERSTETDASTCEMDCFASSRAGQSLPSILPVLTSLVDLATTASGSMQKSMSNSCTGRVSADHNDGANATVSREDRLFGRISLLILRPSSASSVVHRFEALGPFRDALTRVEASLADALHLFMKVCETNATILEIKNASRDALPCRSEAFCNCSVLRRDVEESVGRFARAALGGFTSGLLDAFVVNFSAFQTHVNGARRKSIESTKMNFSSARMWPTSKPRNHALQEMLLTVLFPKFILPLLKAAANRPAALFFVDESFHEDSSGYHNTASTAPRITWTTPQLEMTASTIVSNTAVSFSVSDICAVAGSLPADAAPRTSGVMLSSQFTLGTALVLSAQRVQALLLSKGLLAAGPSLVRAVSMLPFGQEPVKSLLQALLIACVQEQLFLASLPSIGHNKFCEDCKADRKNVGGSLWRSIVSASDWRLDKDGVSSARGQALHLGAAKTCLATLSSSPSLSFDLCGPSGAVRERLAQLRLHCKDVLASRLKEEKLSTALHSVITAMMRDLSI